MATARKYAGLPDLDQAPDIYETPDLADDVSTIPATSARSPSIGSDDGTLPEDDDESGIVRSKVDKSRAFSRFQNSKVDAQKADFSDRLNGTRQYYRTSNRRRRKAYAGRDDGEYDDVSEDEDETLDRKLARLRREIEEARIELAEKDEDRELFSDAPETKLEGDGEGEEHTLDSISKLSEALDAIYTSKNGGSRGPASDLSQTISKFAETGSSRQSTQQHIVASLPLAVASPEHKAQLSQALAKVAEFDTRLSFLEQALGLSGDNLFGPPSEAQKPILHTLSTLDRQIQALTNSSATVDAASSKTRKLIEQVEHLVKVKSEHDALDHPTTEDTDNVSKINALYGTLATIDSLAPTLPMILDRLRTLRLLHTSAAEAGSTLDEIEKRQAEQTREIKQWREALDQVEKNIKSGESALTENTKGVEAWVKDLEARVSKAVSGT